MPGEVLGRRFGTQLSILLVGIGCARPAVVPEPSLRTDPCVIASAPAAAPESLSIALVAPTTRSRGAPVRFDSVRLLWELTYETLIRVDCTGTLIPALAERWEVDSGGREWTFTIHDDRRWHDGEAVTSRDVIAAWRAGHSSRAPFPYVVDSASAIDLHRVRVRLGEGDARVLATPELAIARRRRDSDRMDGTGPYDVNGVPRRAATAGAGNARLPKLKYVDVAPDVDARDVLDRGVDLMFTDDRSVALYAASREGFAVYPLPSQRTYTIVTPRAARSTDSLDAELSVLRTSLVEDVVRAPTQPALGPSWLTTAGTCALQAAGASGPSAGLRQRIAYREDDPVARAIAERLVSIASRPGDSELKRLLGASDGNAAGRIVAEAMSFADHARALRDRTRSAFVVSVAARPLARCGAIRDLATAMPWAVVGGVLDGGFITPLLDAGSWVIVRHGAVGLEAGWDGMPRLVFSSQGSRSSAR